MMNSHETGEGNPRGGLTKPLLGWSPYLTLPNRVGIFGASGSGKTHFLIHEILQQPGSPLDVIIWIAPGFSLQQSEIKSLSDKGFLKARDGREIAFKSIAADGPWLEETKRVLLASKAQGYHSCVVLDDLLATKRSSKTAGLIVELYTAGRHLGVDLLVEMAQRVYSGSDSRTCRLNCNHLIFGTLGGPSEVKRIIEERELDPTRRAVLMRVYKLVTAEPYRFMWLDFSPHGPSDKDLAVRVGWDEIVDPLPSV